MKNWFVILFMSALILLSPETVYAQKFPQMDKSPMDMVYFPARSPFRAFEKDETVKATLTPQMRVIYSRPQLNGRDLTALAKPGEVWRLGANESAELQIITKKMMIGGTKVKRGRYTLYAIPGNSEWTVILNKDLDGWGAYSYDQAQDVLRIQAKTSRTSESVEAFSIVFTDNAMVMAWGDTKVEVPISAP